jgi:hypothetical protein
VRRLALSQLQDLDMDDDIDRFFTDTQLASLCQYERGRFRNIKNNYEAMLALGKLNYEAMLELDKFNKHG